MEHRTLILTSWFFPYQILTWQDAITQIYTGDSTVIATYDEEVRSPSVVMKVPAVVRLRPDIKPKRKVKYSRFNVFVRDSFTCQYCGNKHPMRELTVDHMVPRCRGGKTCWENIVTACKRCNILKKQDMTCDEAGMFPKNLPVRPKSLPLVTPVRSLERAPVEWHEFVRPYLPVWT